MILIELAVESLAAAHAAAAGGADRIELCADLNAAGGLTPSEELTRAVLDDVDIPIYAMVRPRAGDFVCTAREIADMCGAIERLRALGVHGVVAGALTPARGIDMAATATLVSAAAGMPFTFHRAFDRAVDQSTALEVLIELGVNRVLTSGGAATAFDGAERLRALVAQSGGRMAILAGGGVRASNVREVVLRTGVTEVHSKLSDGVGDELRVERVREFCAAVGGLDHL